MRPKITATQIRESIEKIMDWFDFEKVHSTMVALNWIWAREAAIPNIEKIKDHARRLLEESASESQFDYYKCSSGGFHAEREGIKLKLLFVVSNWEEMLDGSSIDDDCETVYKL